jgi:hypothetical protein
MICLWVASAIILIAMNKIAPADILDARLYYNQMEVWSFFTSLSPEEAGSYFLNELLDLVFICIYSSILYLSFKRLTAWKKSWRQIAWLPGFFDLIETSGILITLKTGAITGPVLWLGFVTFAKWLTGALVVVCLLYARFLKQPSSPSFRR